MSIRLFNPSGGFIDLNAGGDGTAANVFTLPAETGTLLTSASNANFPAGSVLQVVSTTKTDTFSSTNAGWLDVTGLSVSITPTSASSKILIFAHLNVVNRTATGSTGRILRDSTAIGIATSPGDRTAGGFAEFYYPNDSIFRSYSSTFLDSPATTSATTYKIQVNPQGFALHLNRCTEDVNQAGNARGVSSITVMEIAA
jgi:hypothetical protein